MSKELGILIKQLREQKGYHSLRGFAKAVGKSPTFMWKVEQGEAVPGSETLDKIAEILGYRDEIFQAASKVQPEIENLINEPEVRGFLRKVSQMTPTKRKEILGRLEENEVYNFSL